MDSKDGQQSGCQDLLPLHTFLSTLFHLVLTKRICIALQGQLGFSFMQRKPRGNCERGYFKKIFYESYTSTIFKKMYVVLPVVLKLEGRMEEKSQGVKTVGREEKAWDVKQI